MCLLSFNYIYENVYLVNFCYSSNSWLILWRSSGFTIFWHSWSALHCFCTGISKIWCWHIPRIAVYICPNLRYWLLMGGCAKTTQRIRIGVTNAKVKKMSLISYNLFIIVSRVVLALPNQEELQRWHLWGFPRASLWQQRKQKLHWHWVGNWKHQGQQVFNIVEHLISLWWVTF